MHRYSIAVVGALALVALAAPAHAQFKFEIARLSGAQEVPPVVSTASGKGKVKFAKDLSEGTIDLKLADIVDVTAAHLHCGRAGAEGDVVVNLSLGGCTFIGDEIECLLTNADIVANTCDDPSSIGRPINNLASLAFAAADGLIYFNVHTLANTGGEIRGQLASK